MKISTYFWLRNHFKNSIDQWGLKQDLPNCGKGDAKMSKMIGYFKV